MHIDFYKVQLVESRINEIIGELTYQRENIKEAIRLLSLNGHSQQNINNLKSLSDKLAQQTLFAMKMREAVKKISSNFGACEERIAQFIDEGKIEKQDFKYCTYLNDNTDFTWSIK